MPDLQEMQICSGGFDGLPYGVSWRHLDEQETAEYCSRYSACPDGNGCGAGTGSVPEAGSLEAYLSSQAAGADLLEVEGGNLVLVPVIWAASMANGQRAAVRHLVHLQEGANLTLIHIAAPADAGTTPAGEASDGGILGISVRAILEKGAHLDLVNIQLLGGSQDFVLETAAGAGEEAGIRETLIQLGGREVSVDSRTGLFGRGASCSVHTGLCAVSGTRRLDIRNLHFGDETESSIEYDGAVAGSASVALHSTADLEKAGTGASFRGRDSLVTLADTAAVVATPELLRGAQDTEAAYDQRSGRPDPQQVFYLETRGIEADRAAGLLAMAGLMNAAAIVPDGRVVQLVSQYARGALGIG